jgi:flagellar assembly protein FliH
VKVNTLFNQSPEAQPAEAVPMHYRDWRTPAPSRPPKNPEPAQNAAAVEVHRLRAELATVREEHESALQHARAQAAEEAREETRSELREALEVERTALAHACTSLAHERTRYFAEMQREVVRLAVAVAERVLHREIEEDPAALAQAVQIALSQLAEPEGAVLHVSRRELERWSRAMRSTGLRIEADEHLSAGEVRLESMGGAAALGWRAQLEEIERGFDDLLERKQA